MTDLKEGKAYVVEVSTQFVGEFKEYVTDPQTGAQYAVFEQNMKTKDKVNMRRTVPANSIRSAELTKLET